MKKDSNLPFIIGRRKKTINIIKRKILIHVETEFFRKENDFSDWKRHRWLQKHQNNIQNAA